VATVPFGIAGGMKTFVQWHLSNCRKPIAIISTNAPTPSQRCGGEFALCFKPCGLDKDDACRKQHQVNRNL
ncbi:MAG: hypothetical protein MJZ94_10260, partial [Bacteroidales bacterium]|nr:hypothetical protein [Bacteroidales bacterium]